MGLYSGGAYIWDFTVYGSEDEASQDTFNVFGTKVVLFIDRTSLLELKTKFSLHRPTDGSALTDEKAGCVN